MSDLKTITHTATLPFGFKVDFAWTDDNMTVEWEPNMPVPEDFAGQALKKFLEHYTKERGVFIQRVANAGGVDVILIDGDTTEIRLTETGEK